MNSINDVVASLIDKTQPANPRPKKPALPEGLALPKLAARGPPWSDR